ncbi:MAG: sulfur carrier protein ThiS [Gammaproteobacteria bacterium]|nr:MAG: sulfur carrier protein ThiS [Gammaproteobacteria bacterium]
MQVTVNGETREIEETLTAEQLIERLGLAGRRLAMEVNGEILPRSRYAEHRFRPGDRIEIVQAIGGGCR